MGDFSVLGGAGGKGNALHTSIQQSRTRLFVGGARGKGNALYNTNVK